MLITNLRTTNWRRLFTTAIIWLCFTLFNSWSKVKVEAKRKEQEDAMCQLTMKWKVKAIARDQ